MKVKLQYQHTLSYFFVNHVGNLIEQILKKESDKSSFKEQGKTVLLALDQVLHTLLNARICTLPVIQIRVY